MTQASHGLFAEHLQAARNLDGFGPREGAAPEPEPTALASLALDDAAGRGWLERRQRDDGGFALVAGPVVNDGATGLCALALGPGTARERALDHLVATRAQATASSADVPHDPNIHGWAWTVGTYGWVEPTSHAILALQALRPEAASAQIADGLALLADRECEGGGWNYGNPIVLGVTLEPYAQTTAMALVALQNAEPGLSQGDWPPFAGCGRKNAADSHSPCRSPPSSWPANPTPRKLRTCWWPSSGRPVSWETSWRSRGRRWRRDLVSGY